MNKFVVALSAVASGRSSWLLIGLTGMAFVRGISAFWAAFGYILVEFLMFLYAAPRLRKETARMNNITISDYLASRHKDFSHTIRILSAIIMIVFMTAYISAQFVGGGKTFSTSFGVSQFTGVIFTAFIVLFYTLTGGFLAVSLTDVIQAVLMMIALFVLPVVAIIDFGGTSELLNAASVVDENLLDPFALSLGALIGFIGIGLGSPGNPHILVRYMSAKDPDELKFSAYIGTFWNASMAIAAVVIGIVGRAYYNAIELLPGSDAENLFPLLAQDHLHPVLFGVIIASILAAIMSTADSMLLVCASSLVRDIYQKTMNPEKEIPEKRLVLLSRIVIIAIVVISFIFGFIAKDLVFWLVLFAWGGLGAAFGPAILLSLFWKGSTREGIISGMISGVITIIVWNQTPFLKNIIYELVPAFIISFGVTILVSYLSRKKQQ